MTYKELQTKIADVEHLMDERYKAAMKAYRNYCNDCEDNDRVIMKQQPQRSQFERQASISIDRLKKEFAMQSSPADVGDVIQTEKHYMKVERIEAAAFEYPTLAFYGTYLRRDLEPRSQQIFKPILQMDIIKVIKINKH